jgi:hypothetical protein
MRTGTYNRFLNQWLFKPDVHANQYLSLDPNLTQRKHYWQQCAPGHLVYSMAEVANVQRLNGNSLSLGTYFWPTFGLQARGIDHVNNIDDQCVAGSTGNIPDIELFCRSKVYLCVDASPNGCQAFYPYKTSVVWEKSTDSGLTWYLLDEGKINFTGNVIVIGQSDWFESSNTFRTQFYGLIDSVRISTGTPRYTGDVAQPFARRCMSYYPQAAIGTTQQELNGKPIDEYVLFALNLWNYGDILIRDPMVDPSVTTPDAYVPIVHMPPGSKTIPYYVKDRGINGGYYVAGDVQNQLFTATDYRAKDPRNIKKTVLTTQTFPAYEKDRQLLSYSNVSAGLFKQWPAIQFPFHTDMNLNATGSPRISQALTFEDFDFMPKSNSGKTKIFDVALATTGPIAGRLAGSNKAIDSSSVVVGSYVLVKNQDNPIDNGIYLVRSQSGGQVLDWLRLEDASTGLPDDLSNTYIRVVGGVANIGTSWIMTTPDPIVGTSELLFEQDKILGTYTDDFCVESWFCVPSFVHPAPSAIASGQSDFPYFLGANMTLLETYYRRRRDGGSPYSGLRIYFKPEETFKTGRIYVDFWIYHSSLLDYPTTPNSWQGPVFMSDVISANKFHHVAVVRNQNVFALYVNGVKQDEILAQQKRFNPQNISVEQNSYMYRAKGFWGRLVDTTDSLSIVVKYPEFTYVSDNGPEYSRNFNGAAGMIRRNNNRTVNLPCEWYKHDATLNENGNCTGFVAGIGNATALTKGTWPGLPIPRIPAKHHVYIINDNLYGAGGSLPKYDFLFAPTMRFPNTTYSVELATAQNGTTDVYNNILPDTGNIDTAIDEENPLYGMTITKIHPETQLPYTATLTIDGVPVKENMRVLVGHQSNESQNGVYIVKTTAWERVPDLSQTVQLRNPYRALVNGGFTNAGRAFVLSIDSLISPINYIIDVTPIEFKLDASTTSSGEQFECYVERSICRGEGVEVADEPVVLVFARTIDNIDLSVGGFPGSANVPLSAYDGNVVNTGFHRVLVSAQTNPAENGIYLMQSGSWTRVEDLKTSAQYAELQAKAENNAILVSPSTGSGVGEGCSIGYRMTPENGTEFLLGTDAIDVSPQIELLNKLYVPTTWTPLDGIIQLNSETQLPMISSDQQITWNDFIPSSDDRSVWRIWTRCGKAVNYSRNVIVRMASALNITQTNSTQSIPPPECI